jgi:hypothetical protein
VWAARCFSQPNRAEAEPWPATTSTTVLLGSPTSTRLLSSPTPAVLRTAAIVSYLDILAALLRGSHVGATSVAIANRCLRWRRVAATRADGDSVLGRRPPADERQVSQVRHGACVVDPFSLLLCSVVGVGPASTSCKACRGTPRAHPGDTFLPRRPLACCACRPSLPSSSICVFCYSADVEVTKQLLAFGLTSNSR